MCTYQPVCILENLIFALIRVTSVERVACDIFSYQQVQYNYGCLVSDTAKTLCIGVEINVSLRDISLKIYRHGVPSREAGLFRRRGYFRQGRRRLDRRHTSNVPAMCCTYLCKLSSTKMNADLYFNTSAKVKVFKFWF